MAKYPRCPVCGATGPIGSAMPNCACDYSSMIGKPMTQPSDRARKAADIEGHPVRDAVLLLESVFSYLGDQALPSYLKRFRELHPRLCELPATFERETPGFAAGVEAAAKVAEEWPGDYDYTLTASIRDLTPAPPADLCADIAQKSADAIKGQDDGR